MDCRLDKLTEWVTQQLNDEGGSGAKPIELEVVSGDASFRRYFRVRGSDGRVSLIAVDAPTPQEDCRPFVAVARALLSGGVMVPEVLAVDYDSGFMLLSDLGDDLLLDSLNASNVEVLYAKALDSLPRIMSCQADVPPYAESKLIEEMSLFPDWFLTKYLDVTVDDQLFKDVFHYLTGSALEQPQVFVHRDYHSRNLMVTEFNALGVIDFQDAVMGPITYDIVSLLRDCYVAWPHSRIESWVDGARKLLQEHQILPQEIDQRQFMKWFDLMGAQRHLKAVGIFARLNCRDGKPGYLLDIPRTLRYLLDICDTYKMLNELAGEIRSGILPALFEKNKQASQWFQKNHYVDIELNIRSV